ncbi:small ribosomal subunit protein bS21, partial [Streptococcus pneumoniae]|uniref:small ribosomal subunit protein bS21 n=1 Tax=Streptococcus pneumoniae TaxID=1313 RepID=UPI00122F7F0B
MAKTVRVELRDNESFEALLKRFTKELQKSGVLRDYRAKRPATGELRRRARAHFSRSSQRGKRAAIGSIPSGR